jgi:pantoate--beta-alanine ligase
MQIFQTVAELQNCLNTLRNSGKTIGFVPTMGALHAGHISLVKNAKGDNDYVLTSIFVNPTQFNNATDLQKYPRIPEKDLPLLEQAGCDLVFMPTVEEMYHGNTVSDRKNIVLGSLGEVMEAKHRPGHFDGVITIVRKLFEASGRCKAYFGLKDFQQLAVVRLLVKSENIPVDIIPCPIVREADGLAMSSRNMRLSETQRKAATIISKALFEASLQWETKSVAELHELVIAIINHEPEVKLEYFEIADRDTLLPVTEKKNAVMCIAAYLGEVRLIDNILPG